MFGHIDVKSKRTQFEQMLFRQRVLIHIICEGYILVQLLNLCDVDGVVLNIRM